MQSNFYGRVPYLDKDVSRLVMGNDNQATIESARIVWDDYFERGGNCFDNSVIYGGGRQDTLLGQWLQERGVRDECAIIVKGAHTPDCYPEKLSEQLDISLDRMGIEGADLYMLHRDNLEVPVGEFVDVLNRHVGEGKMKAFGGSNWSLARVKEANEYAAKNGLQPMSIVSNNLSLARMVDPVWSGCVTVHNKADRDWLAENGMALFSWSSQARGFFIRADREFTEDGELVRCWYSDDNFARLERVQQMSAERGIAPINIALAWLLHQPFPTFPLIGPRTTDETQSSWKGLDVELSPEDVAWLVGD
ncbi:MAG TPA: aldo/keto reductase [Abditibacteriaceae bacterium]|jgi:aryl-alcohol dehydrogenase-like predicted oxidoreductase